MRTEISLPFIATREGGEGVHLTRVLTRDEFAAITEDLVQRTLDVCTDVLEAVEVPKEQVTDVLLVGGSSRLPAVQAAVTACFGRPPSQRVNPDEAVAIGAALHAHLLLSSDDHSHLLDVTPQTLGILTEGAKPYPVIPRNTRVPTKKTLKFPTRQGQTNVDLVVIQGDSKVAKGNAVLGKFRVSGFSKEPTQVAVTFAIDSDGIVKVTARDGAGQEQSLTVLASSGLTPDEIARMAAQSNQYLADRKAEAERTGALQEVQKALAILERGRTETAAALGSTGSGAAVIARATALIEAARTTMGQASLAELGELGAQLTNMTKTLRKT
jgi:molecular chaperone DnaK